MGKRFKRSNCSLRQGTDPTLQPRRPLPSNTHQPTMGVGLAYRSCSLELIAMPRIIMAPGGTPRQSAMMPTAHRFQS